MDTVTPVVEHGLESEVPPEYLTWAADLAEEAIAAGCLTMGIVNASSYPSEYATLRALCAAASTQVEARRGRCLLLRLGADPSIESAELNLERIPVAQRCPLGPWSETVVTPQHANEAMHVSQCLSAWLPEWKESFQLILVDLGPIDTSLSRLAGRLCDASFLLLGPKWCGAQEWITQQIAWHHQSGSTVCGTVLAE